MSVQFRFVTESGIRHLGSWLIRRFTYSEISHVDLVMPDGQMLGARSNAISYPGRAAKIPAGVQIRPVDYLKFSRVIFAFLPCTEAQADVIYSAAKSQVGKSYDLDAIVDFVVEDADKGPNDGGSASWMCSELAAWVALKGDVPLVNPKVNYRHVTPEQLLMSPVLRY